MDAKEAEATHLRYLTAKMDKLAYALATDPLYRQADNRREAEARLEQLAVRHNQVVDDAETYTPPVFGWVCFQCGHRFFDEHKAREHFGDSPTQRPICQA